MGNFLLSNRPAVVYQAVNRVNGKRYIGATTKPLDQRRRAHERDASAHRHKGAFHRAIRKYGAEAFAWSILSEHPFVRDAAAEETALILLLKPEYNSTPGGLGFHVRPWSEDMRVKMSETKKNFYKSNPHPMSGRRHTEASRRLMSDKLKGKPTVWKGRKRPAAFGAMISARQAKRLDKHLVLPLGPKSLQRRTVCLNDGKEYESASAAAIAYDVDKSQLIKVCKRLPVRRSVGGLVFRYYGDHYGGLEEALSVLEEVRQSNARRAAHARTLQNGRNGRNKLVKCLTDGNVFESVKEAAAAYGKNPMTISNICMNGRAGRKRNQLYFAFVDAGGRR